MLLTYCKSFAIIVPSDSQNAARNIRTSTLKDSVYVDADSVEDDTKPGPRNLRNVVVGLPFVASGHHFKVLVPSYAEKSSI